MNQSLHQSVLLQAATEALAINPSGRYLDATFGRGGHANEILKKLNAQGRLDVIDRDPEALLVAGNLADSDSRVTVFAGDFESVITEQLSPDTYDGVLFDFGVSSPQIDQAERGFSFQKDGPLDMRMDNHSGDSAADWLAVAGLDEMRQIFWRYGEEKNARRIAQKIIDARDDQPLTRTSELADLVSEVNKAYSKKHPATRVFQAIRIHINDELGQIERSLPESLALLKAGGRLVVISFHSLEDRLVKRFMKKQAKPIKVDRRMPIMPDNLPQATIKIIGKPVKAYEVDANIRARSAVMRVAKRL
ncbi:16S rRNA (cytosine(1402)-N(4))-methyltransferase RsmH [Marinicella gelatinilytica]|uniref:16S rRNA (cytosine(1402)-N(4))-methyltransferase RsmH n=1 Tax=Marinicella gelatinilytica TaxID=2996017 RepID=UPI002260C5A7|nr:16S rRNA (cytosine(1402)-N(4))-methyltransferase RsmH [Marinicella gelatinilytica]MCX7545149.1 16S rRNA (cytosine(1402)-N(4))-methyltransferase RsmH [Marinicella gelatinilytica]